MARLDPVKGSEQAGIRPVIVISRQSINNNSPVVVVIPCTSARDLKKIYPGHVRLPAGEGGLKNDSIALAEQIRAISRDRLEEFWGTVGPKYLNQIEEAIQETLDLPEFG